jgi:hypothetical protein
VAPDRAGLRGDCASCFGLCCVIPAFAASADFAIDKPAGRPCPNLSADFRCGIHQRLRPSGFPGCTVYDCFGAGQVVSRLPAERRATAFPVVRALHEMLWYLAEALVLAPSPEVTRVYEETRALARSPAGVDLDARRRVVGELLRQVSASVRTGPDRSGADLAGARLGAADLTGVSLRGALLIGADLRGARLSRADLLGADLRAARLAGADLRTALFVTQPQLDAALGDARTRLPGGLSRPAHWAR